MIKARIHIKTEHDSMDEEVFVNILLPNVPQIGHTLYLSEEMVDKLESMAKSDLKISSKYAIEWFYGNSCEATNIQEENLADLSFADAMIVSAIAYTANSEYVDIELSK